MLKEDVSVLFLCRPSKILVKGKIRRVVVAFLGRSLMTCLVVNLFLGRLCLWCFVCLMCLSLPSFVVTECFDDVSLDPDWEFVES